MDLLVWGTGKLSIQFMENGYNGRIIGFIETHKSCNFFQGKQIYGADEIPDEYDFIVVANSYATEIYYICIENGIDLKKVIFLYGVKKRVGYTELPVLKKVLGEKNYALYCGEFSLVDESFLCQDIRKYNKLNSRKGFSIQQQYMWPVITDKYASAGAIGNYFWQDLWAARLVVKSGVKEHFDIGSRLDGFIAHLLAAGIDVTMIDIREFPDEVEHLHTIVDDATNLRQIPDGSLNSMSALCSLEHFGLGRYGDPVDPEACFKCFASIQRKLKKGGKLYISLPIGRERLEFNAHRVFFADTVIRCFDTLELEEFSCTSQGKIEYNVDIHKYDNDTHNGEYRYGMFSFVK